MYTTFNVNTSIFTLNGYESFNYNSHYDRHGTVLSVNRCLLVVVSRVNDQVRVESK